MPAEPLQGPLRGKQARLRPARLWLQGPGSGMPDCGMKRLLGGCEAPSHSGVPHLPLRALAFERARNPSAEGQEAQPQVSSGARPSCTSSHLDPVVSSTIGVCSIPTKHTWRLPRCRGEKPVPNKVSARAPSCQASSCRKAAPGEEGEVPPALPSRLKARPHSVQAQRDAMLLPTFCSSPPFLHEPSRDPLTCRLPGRIGPETGYSRALARGLGEVGGAASAPSSKGVPSRGRGGGATGVPCAPGPHFARSPLPGSRSKASGPQRPPPPSPGASGSRRSFPGRAELRLAPQSHVRRHFLPGGRPPATPARAPLAYL